MTNKIAIFCTENFLITIHKYDSAFLDELGKKKQPVNDLTTTELLAKIVWQALETYDGPANKLSEKVDFYEDQLLLRKTGSDLSEALYYIKRHATVCQKVIMLMQEPINHINVSHHESSNLQDVRDQHLKMQILYTQILDETNNLLTLSTSFSAQRTNEVVRILTIFSVFFMPVTFIVGVYGMNFKYMPELQLRWGYPAVLLFMGLVSGAIFFWFKRKKWI
jgi:magnesium transporter